MTGACLESPDDALDGLELETDLRTGLEKHSGPLGKPEVMPEVEEGFRLRMCFAKIVHWDIPLTVRKNRGDTVSPTGNEMLSETFRDLTMDVASDDLEARLQRALLAFRAIPPKPPKPSTERKQAVATLFDELTRLKTQGYDFEELREFVLEHAEVEMTTGTLRKYWSAERRRRQGKKPQQKRSGKPKRNTKSSVPTQEPEKPVKVDEENELEQKKAANRPEPAATTVNPVTPDDDSKDAWPGQAPEADSPSESEPETPTKQQDPDSWNDDDDDDLAWSGGDWGDDNPPAGGLLNERKFNVIVRD